MPLLFLVLLVTSQVMTSATQERKAVWTISHAYGPPGKTTLAMMREAARNDGINAVEIDMLYHTDRFHAAHDHIECSNHPARAAQCLELVPMLQEVESNPNITMLWIDPKDQSQWRNTSTGRTMLLSDLAEVVREHVKTKPIWWGLGESGAISRGDVEELVARAPLPALEGVSFDYGKSSEHAVTVQDLYLRARKAGIQNIGHSNKPQFGYNSCFELNKAFAFLAEGKLSRVLSWTINEHGLLRGLYQTNGAKMTSCGSGDNDEGQLVGAVEGIISDLYTGVRNQRSVVEADPTLRLATSDDVFWTPRSQLGVEPRHDNVLANGGAEMPPLPNSLASSWRLDHTHRAGALSLTDGDCPGVTAPSGSRYFGLGARCGAETHMYQDVVVRAYEKEIDAGTMSGTVSASFFINGAAIRGFARLEYFELPGDNRVRFELATNVAETSNGTWVTLRGSVQLRKGTRVVRVYVSAKSSAERCRQPYWNAGSCPHNHLFVDNAAFMIHPTITATQTRPHTKSHPASHSVTKSMSSAGTPSYSRTASNTIPETETPPSWTLSSTHTSLPSATATAKTPSRTNTLFLTDTLTKTGSPTKTLSHSTPNVTESLPFQPLVASASVCPVVANVLMFCLCMTMLLL